MRRRTNPSSPPPTPSKKRRWARDAPVPSLCLQDMPDEILLRIVSFLPLSVALVARRTCIRVDRLVLDRQPMRAWFRVATGFEETTLTAIEASPDFAGWWRFLHRLAMLRRRGGGNFSAFTVQQRAKALAAGGFIVRKAEPDSFLAFSQADPMHEVYYVDTARATCGCPYARVCKHLFACWMVAGVRPPPEAARGVKGCLAQAVDSLPRQ
jgi:hypothetical protein